MCRQAAVRFSTAAHSILPARRRLFPCYSTGFPRLEPFTRQRHTCSVTRMSSQAKFESHGRYATATRQLRATLNQYDLLCDVGSGDGAYLDYLRTCLPEVDIIGSDSDNDRVEVARKAYPHVQFTHANAVEMVRKHRSPRTRVLAMHVLGNMSPDLIGLFLSEFAVPRMSLTLCAVSSRKLDQECPPYYEQRCRQSGFRIVSCSYEDVDQRTYVVLTASYSG
jgi:hypothetical protein